MGIIWDHLYISTGFFSFPCFFPLLYVCLKPLIPGHSFVPPQILDSTPRAALCTNPACPTQHLLPVTLTALRKQTRYSADPRPRPTVRLTLQVSKPRTVETGYHLWQCLLNPYVCVLLLALLIMVLLLSVHLVLVLVCSLLWCNHQCCHASVVLLLIIQ